MPSIRILIADDYKDWRSVVGLLLQARPEWQIIAEASDGSEAVQKAKELKPDLILLDIGLPKLNGIEAALQIKQLSPGSKIIFVSLYNSQDIVQAALGTGARGYVHKTDANGELSPAVEAVLQGRQYVSSGAKDYIVTETPVEKPRHEVLFYDDDKVLLDRLSRFVAAALEAGNAAIVLATEAHRDSLFQRLKAGGVDADAALRQGTYISLDAADVLSRIMINDLPDSTQFFGVLGGFIEAGTKAAKPAPRMVAYGEAVNLLKAQGKPDAAIRLEQLWNDAGKTFGLDILCGYDLGNFHGAEDEHVFHSICAEHSAAYSQ